MLLKYREINIDVYPSGFNMASVLTQRFAYDSLNIVFPSYYDPSGLQL